MADVELTADALLTQIHSEPLQYFLATVRGATSCVGSTYLPVLDAHMTSVNSRRISKEWSLNRGDVIEVQGPAASGKTHFLYHMLCTCLLPSAHYATTIGGWDKAAILFDTDGKFSISRLHELMISRFHRLLETGQATPPNTSISDLVSQCLEHLHVFRPSSSVQLAMTLLHLPSYHARNSRCRDKEIGLLAIDSISAFYWRDRYALEQLRDLADDPSIVLPPNAIYHVLKALQEFRLSHRPVILMTNWGLNPLESPDASSESAPPFYRQHLYPFPAPFEAHGTADALSALSSSQPSSDTDPPVPIDDTDHAQQAPSTTDVTLPLHYHITLHPSRIDPFPASYSLADANSQEHMRAKFVNRGEVRGLVRTPGEDAVVEFTFYIGAKEILVDTLEPEQGKNA